MSLKLMRGYVLVIFGLLILVAAAVLVLTNMDPWTLHVYWTNKTLPQAVWLLLSAVAGVVVWYTVIRLLPAGVATLRKGKKIRQAKDNHQRIKDLEKQKDNPA